MINIPGPPRVHHVYQSSGHWYVVIEVPNGPMFRERDVPVNADGLARLGVEFGESVALSLFAEATELVMTTDAWGAAKHNRTTIFMTKEDQKDIFEWAKEQFEEAEE